MSQDNESVTEVRNNFKPVNDYIEHLLDRQRDLLKYRRFKRWQLIMFGLAVIIVAAGLSYLLYSWGLYLQKERPHTKVAIEAIKQSYESSAADSKPTSNDVRTIKVEYTVFKTVEVSNQVKVVTGYQYSPDKPDFPINQFCYVDKPSAQARSDTFWPAEKRGRGAVVWRPEVPANLFSLAQEHCQFMD